MTDSDYPESGPFCRHWADPSDCEERCFRCGHSCGAHHPDDDCDHCDCAGWLDEADAKPTTELEEGRCNSQPVGPSAAVRRQMLVRAASAEEHSARDSRMNVRLREQILRATRERRALLGVVRAKPGGERKKAMAELAKAYPKWREWA